ncbi:MAG TPA: S24 family peptidase [Gammaproteobacteria bacterium]|nr:S24 family peptidase [Gammaproteobacteria bacterium]
MRNTLIKKLNSQSLHSNILKSGVKLNIAINLRKLLVLANLSEGELSRRTKIKQPIIHRLLSGENKNPKLMTLKPIADYFKLSISQLIGEHEISTLWRGFTSQDHHGWVEVPLINWEEQIRASNKQKPSQFIVTECNVGKEAFAFYISDQSMEPVIPEKSIVIIEPELIPLNGNYIAIKQEKGEIMIRNFLLASGIKYISPLNHKYGTIEKLSAKSKILGTIIRTIYDHKYIT